MNYTEWKHLDKIIRDPHFMIGTSGIDKALFYKKTSFNSIYRRKENIMVIARYVVLPLSILFVFIFGLMLINNSYMFRP